MGSEMIMASDIPWGEMWAWASGSSLLSTVMTLVVGAWLLYKWQARRSFEYEVVKFVSDEIASYADDAVQYWGSFVGKALNRGVVQQKIRNGLPVLFELISNAEVLDGDGKEKVHEALGNLFDVATGGSFESSEDDQKEEAESRIGEILLASTIARRVMFLAAIKK